MIKIFLSGCHGRMGQAIQTITREQSADFTVVAGSDLTVKPDTPFPVYQDAAKCRQDFDVAIDFSNPAALPSLLQLVTERQKPLVLCTTGHSAANEASLTKAGRKIALFKSANMSLGIHILIHLARQAAAVLYPQFNIEIIEAHHNQKIDAPSGTALLIADQIKEQLSQETPYVYDRSAVRQKRTADEIGIHAIRGGTIVGQHSVLFAGPQETLTLKHTAENREIFAHGALAAARFIVGKPAGFYSMADLIDQTIG